MLKVIAPRLPQQLEDSDSWAIVPEATIEGVRIDGGEIIGKRMPAISLDEVRLDRVVLTQSKLEKLTVRDTIINGKVSFDGCELEQADFNHTQLIAAAPYLAAEIGLKVD